MAAVPLAEFCVSFSGSRLVFVDARLPPLLGPTPRELLRMTSPERLTTARQNLLPREYQPSTFFVSPRQADLRPP